MLYHMVINVKKRIKKLFAVLLTVISLLALGIPAFAAENGSTAGTVRITSGSLNVRAGASTSSAVIASLYKGETVTLLQKSGNFWKVEYGSGQYGYASADYIAPVSGSYAARVQTAGGNLNVRAGAGTSYAVRTARRAVAKRRLGENSLQRQKHRLRQQHLSARGRLESFGRVQRRKALCGQL